MRLFIKKYDLPVNLLFIIDMKKYEKKKWSRFVTKKNKHLATDQAIDLLEKMLIYDWPLRISAKEAMKHPYFDNLRK